MSFNPWPVPALLPAGPLPCSAIILAKNEGKMIGEVVSAARLYAMEVLVVDGSSTDDTAAQAARSGARVIKDAGLGKGEAIRAGSLIALYDSLVFLDADGSHTPHDIPAVVQPVIDGKADLVIASRITGGSDESSGNFEMFVRLLSGQVITLLINWRWKRQISDSQNGFRAIRKDKLLALQLRENLHTIEQEMLMRALRKGYIVSEVPSHEYRRVFGKSHIRLWHMGIYYLISLIKGIFAGG